MLFLCILISLAYSQIDAYAGINENFPDSEDAQAACASRGMNLCTYNQLYMVAYSVGASYKAVTDICMSGFMANDANGAEVAGWWIKDEGCGNGSPGFRSYRNPSGPGAHCCTNDVPTNVAPAQCKSSSAVCEGTNILADSKLEDYCDNGVCTDAACCMDFQAAPVYTVIGDGDSYANAEEADLACTAFHPDLSLCQRFQLEDASNFLTKTITSDDQPIACGAGWYIEDGEEKRGWYNSEAEAAAGLCGGRAGWKAYAPGTAARAHCCVASYTQGNGYYAIGTLTGVSMEDKQVAARAYCDNYKGYPYQLCTQRQLWQVAFSGEESANNVCMSGILENNADSPSDSTCGWEQVSTDCGNGSTGWKGWCPDYAGAHCCLNYVSDWYPSYTNPGTGYDLYPEFYSESSFNNKAAARTWCQGVGFADVCTVGQVKHVAENQADYGNKGCLVGWATDADGNDARGYWGTACGRDDKWYDAWQPTPDNPVAHCCDPEVPESATVAKPMVKGTGSYQFDSLSAALAANACNAEQGYSVCTRDQIELIATVGVTHNGVEQIEENLCHQGYMADGSKGWYQTSDAACGGKTGWREFNGLADVFCCQPYEANIGPTQPPAIPLYVFDGAWVYPYSNRDDALAACQATDARYELCTDDQVVELTKNGAESTDDQFEDAGAIAELAGWTAETVGRYQMSKSDWNDWTSGGNAGAHCCAIGQVANAPAFPDGTVAPTDMPTEKVTTTQAAETTTAPAASPTALDTTKQPTAFVPYSDLPSTKQRPEGCVDRPDLTPEGFQNVVLYCETSDMIYVNGQTTCVSPDTADADSLVKAAFESNWYLAHNAPDNADCGSDLKDYDLATDDQLYITNTMLDNLEDDIDAVEADMSTQSADLDAYLATWKADVAQLIEDSKANFDQTTRDALDAYVANNLEN